MDYLALYSRELAYFRICYTVSYLLQDMHSPRPLSEKVYLAFLHLRLALNGLREDAGLLLRTKTAYGTMILFGWITLAAFVPPVQHTSAERTPLSAVTALFSGGLIGQSATGAGTNVAGIAETGSVVQEEHMKLDPPPGVTPQHPPVEFASIPVAPAHKPWNQRGVFLTPSSVSSDDYRGKTINRLRAVGGNAIIFDVKGSAVHFDAKDVPMAEELGLLKPWYKIEDIVRILHENDIYAIARYIAIKDHSLTSALPRTELRHPRTGASLGYGWVDPAHPDVLEYNRQIICDLAKSGVDEINLDYIRYDTRVAGSIMAAYTTEERIGKIESFIRMSREAIDECGPNTKLGVSTFAILGWNYERNVPSIGQDVVRFAHMLDVISPMAYNANFSMHSYSDPTGQRGRWNYLVYRTLTGYAEELGPEHAWKLRPWLQGWGVGTNEMVKQMQGVFDAGSCGFLVWNADNAYDPSYKAMERIDIPEHCRFPVVTDTI